jgi:predicted transcriptional regulator
MLIDQIYHKQIKTINENETIQQAIKEMIEMPYNGFIVTNDKEKIVGVLSLQDIAGAAVPDEFKKNISLPLAMYKKGFFHEICAELKEKKVKELMRTSYTQVTLQTNILAVAADFLKNDLYIVPVIENDKLLGVITRTEIKKALALEMGIL